MVLFTHIRINGDYIYATAKDLKTNEEVAIKLHKSSDEFYISNGINSGDFVKALGNLQCEYMKKGKLPDSYEVNWG